jgi:hypothetical protein
MGTKYPLGSINNPGIVTVTKPKPTPQESKVRKRPGYSAGGKVEMETLKAN